MEELKDALKSLPNVEKVYVAADGHWHFQEPKTGEYACYTREEVLGVDKKKESGALKDEQVEEIKEAKPVDPKPGVSEQATSPIPKK